MAGLRSKINSPSQILIVLVCEFRFYFILLNLNDPNHSTMTFTLTNPPNEERKRELWLQHAAGFILFQDIRQYAIDRIPSDMDDNTKELIVKGIDDALYGLMMIMDGATGHLQNDQYAVSIENIIKLTSNGETIQEINTFDGDGMCMAFHGWKENDFGDTYPVQE